MLTKYSLKRTGIMTYSKVDYDENNPYFFIIVDSKYLYESRVWVDFQNPEVMYIDDFGLKIDTKKFNELISKENSIFFDLILNSKNAKVFRIRRTAEVFAKKHNFPWMPIKTPKGMRYVIITNPPRCCTLDAIQYKEPNNPFV